MDYLRINEVYQKKELEKTNKYIDINKITIKNLNFSYENNCNMLLNKYYEIKKERENEN